MWFVQASVKKQCLENGKLLYYGTSTQGLNALGYHTTRLVHLPPGENSKIQIYHDEGSIQSVAIFHHLARFCYFLDLTFHQNLLKFMLMSITFCYMLVKLVKKLNKST